MVDIRQMLSIMWLKSKHMAPRSRGPLGVVSDRDFAVHLDYTHFNRVSRFGEQGMRCRSAAPLDRENPFPSPRHGLEQEGGRAVTVHFDSVPTTKSRITVDYGKSHLRCSGMPLLLVLQAQLPQQTPAS